MTSGRSTWIILVCCAAVLFGCSSTAGSTSGWATRIEPPPKGLTLDPPPPSDVYWVAIASAKIPARNSGGQLWDEVGGWPDPVAVLFIDGKKVMETSAATDTTTPTWTTPRGNLHIPDGSTLTVDVSDQDAIQNLPIGKATAGPPTPTDISDGRMIFDLRHRAELIVRVEPAHGLLGLGFDYEVVAGTTVIRKVMKHSPAGRVGLSTGDELVKIGDRMLSGAKSREIRSAVNSIGTVPAQVIVKHKSGTTETLTLSVGPIYPLYHEYGDLD